MGEGQRVVLRRVNIMHLNNVIIKNCSYRLKFLNINPQESVNLFCKKKKGQ